MKKKKKDDYIIIFGTINIKNKKIPDIIKITFTDGSQPLFTKIKHLYSIKVNRYFIDKIILLDKDGEKLDEKSFMPQNFTFRYDF